jgi:hypothetical protein
LGKRVWVTEVEKLEVCLNWLGWKEEEEGKGDKAGDGESLYLAGK